MMVPIYQVDSFAAKPFRGNPAAVCILNSPAEENWLLAVAREMNLSETAFILKTADGYDLRWFTPVTEVDLCGHATLASAHVLWQHGYLEKHKEARFHTRSGLLTAKLKDNWIQLNFPAEPPVETVLPEEAIKALGVKPLYSGKNRLDYLVEVDSEETVRNLKPDFQMLKKSGIPGVIVTSLSSSVEYDFVSRCFAPGVGIDEDPVTGSAHCCLGPFWAERLKRETFTAYQASARGGIVKVELAGNRVHLAGQAVTVFRGELLV